ncbi:hypothetical protein [Streptomyces sp. NPDC051452]|uniref:hypothetical protein n=1 Tax=Streptomyces sp. NPDC051452 TaxID=3365654 RepID=UPI003789D8D7
MGASDPAGGGADLVNGGAFVGADDLPFGEEDDGQGDLLDHGGQVRWQACRATPLDALDFVDDERTCLAGGAAQGAGLREQLAGRVVVAEGVEEVGA